MFEIFIVLVLVGFFFWFNSGDQMCLDKISDFNYKVGSRLDKEIKVLRDGHREEFIALQDEFHAALEDMQWEITEFKSKMVKKKVTKK